VHATVLLVGSVCGMSQSLSACLFVSPGQSDGPILWFVWCTTREVALDNRLHSLHTCACGRQPHCRSDGIRRPMLHIYSRTHSRHRGNTIVYGGKQFQRSQHAHVRKRSR